MEHTDATRRENSRRIQLIITEVHNGKLVPHQQLIGDLFDDESIVQCRSPYGQASVEFDYSSKILYACLEPVPGYQVDHARNHEIFLAEIKSAGMPTMKADLTTDVARCQLLHGRHLFLGIKSGDMLSKAHGIVRYRKNNGFHVLGEFYEFPKEAK